MKIINLLDDVYFVLYACYLKFFGKLGYRQKVSAIIVDREYFLIDQLTTYDSNKWNFPGGGIENGETEEEALARELREELGSENFKIVKKAKNIEKYDWPLKIIIRRLKAEGRTWKGQDVRYFLVKFIGKRNEINPDPGEIRKIKWVKRQELKEYFNFPNQNTKAQKVLDELLH